MSMHGGALTGLKLFWLMNSSTISDSDVTYVTNSAVFSVRSAVFSEAGVVYVLDIALLIV